MDQYIGRLLDGRYEILEIIGTGGMAVVYKARCHRLNRLVAIKILKDEFAGDEEFRRRFRAEGEAVAMLSHPNIVQVYDVSSTENANFIVMELIDGISLKQYMEKKGVLNWKETLHFAMQIAKGLEHAHSRGIIHRDIKPHNVMVLKNGSVKVMDFGIARVMNKSNTLTKEALGSVHYISPEQAKGGHTDNRCDLYSLSVVMYEMMTGRPPYDGESAVSVAIQHINGGARLPSSLNPNIPGGLEQIIMKGMRIEMRDRYASATEMIQDMEEFRKNPAITFDYHSVLDESTRALPIQHALQTERKIQSSAAARAVTDSMRLRQAGQPRRTAPPVKKPEQPEQISRTQQRRQAQEKKRQEERSRITITAIVVCSAVAVIAIIAILVALFNGLLLNRERDLLDVPYLEGKVYDEEQFLAEYTDFNIRQRPQEYSESYEAGQIMRQTPAGGNRVQRSSNDIWITVSMGPEPEVTTMENFTDIDAAQAETFLTTQGYKVLIRWETSAIYDKDQVIRTDPAFGGELVKGQTVYLYVSSGEDVVEETMPDVVGLELSRAMELLEQVGFRNVRPEGVQSLKAKDTVVYQSEKKNETVDVTKEIIIHYSLGDVEETDPTDSNDSKGESEEKTLGIMFSVPVSASDYTLDICLKGSKEVIATCRVTAGESSVLIAMTGSGSVYYDLYKDGEFIREQKVTFTYD